MQLRIIIPKVPPVKLVHSDVSRAAWTVGETASFLSPSQRRSQRKTPWWKEERFVLTGKAKDPQTPDHLLQPPAAGSEQEVPANSVSGSAGESRARRVSGAHANTGMCSASAPFSINELDFVNKFTQIQCFINCIFSCSFWNLYITRACNQGLHLFEGNI